MASTIQDFISALRNSSPQAHIFHHQTDSFAEHMALGGYYEEILDHVDGLVESIQGVYPRIVDYKPAPQYPNWVSTEVTIQYFKALYSYVQTERKNIYQETWVQNQIDTIAELIASTLYKLSLK
jgi:hypothetical protein